jgi:hypothetical protein
MDVFTRLREKGYRYYIDPYDKVLECRNILSRYRYLKTGDIIMPDHTNTLIDVVRCLDETVRQLPLTKEIVMVDTGDWDTAKRYVTDGTIIFVDYGIQTITPEEVRKIVDTIKAVFVILMDVQPAYGRDVGAFYDVFYTHRNPKHCDSGTGCYNIVDAQFVGSFGLHGCLSPECRGVSRVWGAWDYMVHADYKVEHAKPWVHGPCGYAYAKYGAGWIIEMPYDGVWRSVEDLDMYIGMISHVLLGEEVSCQIGSKAKKLRRVIWMATYTSNMRRIHKCFPVDQCLAELASRLGWRLIDLRKG